jgi:hypothetical protein
MPLNPQILALLQTAGQSLYDANQALQTTVTQYAESVQSALALNPFDLSNDARVEEWKDVARLSKAVAQIEDELRKVYGVADAWTSPGVIASTKVTAIALPAFAASAELQVLPAVEATDVIDKRQRKGIAKTKRKVTSGLKIATPHANELRGNAAKLLAALQNLLSHTSYTKLNLSGLALELGFPKGSIGASFAKLKVLGYLEEDAHGALRFSQKPQ